MALTGLLIAANVMIMKVTVDLVLGRHSYLVGTALLFVIFLAGIALSSLAFAMQGRGYHSTFWQMLGYDVSPDKREEDLMGYKND